MDPFWNACPLRRLLSAGSGGGTVTIKSSRVRARPERLNFSAWALTRLSTFVRILHRWLYLI